MPDGELAHPLVPDPSPSVQGTRVRLRAATAADAGALLEISVYDGVAARTVAEVVAHLERIADDQARRETVHWAIEDAATAELVGTVGLYRGFAGGVGEVGYVLRPTHRKLGFMTEAVALVLAFAFDALGLVAVAAHADADNRASIAVLERCGFELVGGEGTRRTYRVDRPARTAPASR